MNITYSFLDVNAAITGPGGAFSLGNGSGVSEEGISVSASEDIGSMHVGADGSGMHSLHADKSGKVTVRMLKTSPTNQQLSSLYAFQTSSGSSYGQNTIVITDKSRGDVITCEQCGFARAPDLNYAKDGGIVEWVFNSIRINRSLGS